MIVGNIPIKKFDAKEFYEELSNNIRCKTEVGLQEVKESLLERSTKLKQKGLSVPQQTATPLLHKEAEIIEEYRAELTRYNQDLEVYKEAEVIFNERKKFLGSKRKSEIHFRKILLY